MKPSMFINGNRDPLIQVGVSVYKQPLSFVQKCLSSALSQTLDDALVTVRLDGPDSCSQDVSEYLSLQVMAHPRLRVICGSERLGVYGSLNSIFSTSSSKYLCQLDADDYLADGALSATVGFLEGHTDVAMVYTDCIETDYLGVPLRIGLRSQTKLNDLNLLVQFIPFHLRVIRRSAFNSVGGYDSRFMYAGDYDLSLRIYQRFKLSYINRPLYFYRVHNSSASHENIGALNSEVFAISQRFLGSLNLSTTYSLLMLPDGSLSLIPVECPDNDETNIFYLSPVEALL